MAIMMRRGTTHIIRNTDQLLGTFFQSIVFLVLFTSVFGGAIVTSTSYINFSMAGIIVQTIPFGSTTTAIAICNDLQKGIVDRFRPLPMSSLVVLNGHVVSTFSVMVICDCNDCCGTLSIDWYDYE
jgi:ABC-2 type transport system permease protein